MKVDKNFQLILFKISLLIIDMFMCVKQCVRLYKAMYFSINLLYMKIPRRRTHNKSSKRYAIQWLRIISSKFYVLL